MKWRACCSLCRLWSEPFSADGGPTINTDMNCLLCRYGKYWLPLNIVSLFVCVIWCTNVAFLSLAFCPFFSSPSSRLILVSRRIISWDGLLVENSWHLSLTQGTHMYDALQAVFLCMFLCLQRMFIVLWIQSSFLHLLVYLGRNSKEWLKYSSDCGDMSSVKTDRRVPNLERAICMWRIESSSHGRLHCIYALFLGYVYINIGF